jgi:pilus assembly protein CpaE
MSTIAVVSDLVDAVELVRGACGAAPAEVVQVAAAHRTADEIVDELSSADHAVVVIGPELDDTVAVSLASLLDQQAPEVGKVLWAEPTAELLMRAISAGVRGVLPANPTLAELKEALTRAFEAVQRTEGDGGEPEPDTGRVIVVTSPKGGTGKTTVAANLAIVLADSKEHSVVLVDLDLQFGDVEYALRLRPERTMSDAVQLGSGLDRTSVKGYLTPHPSGVFALCAPSNPAEAEVLDHAVVARVLDLLADIFDYVVVDTASGIDDHMLNALDRATDVVLLVATDVPTVRSAQKSLAVFRQLGHSERPWHIVMNRADAKVGLGPEDVEEAIGVKADARIPESKAVGAAMNHGSPVVESQPKSPPAKALINFAFRFRDHQPEASGRRRRFERTGAA